MILLLFILLSLIVLFIWHGYRTLALAALTVTFLLACGDFLNHVNSTLQINL